jgi:hypothetical protein
MEWWSSGVMKRPIQVEIRAFAFANTPILQYSSTPKQLAIFTSKAIELCPGPEAGFSMFHESVPTLARKLGENK